MSIRNTAGKLTATYAALTEVSIGGWSRLQVNTANFSSIYGIAASTADYILAETTGDGVTMTTFSEGGGAVNFGPDVVAVGQWFFYVIEAKSGSGCSAFWLNGGGIGALNTASDVTVLTHSMTSFSLFDSVFTGEFWNGDIVNAKIFSKNKGATFWRNQMGRRLPIETVDFVGYYPLLNTTSYLKNWVAGGPSLTATGTAATNASSPPIAGM